MLFYFFLKLRVGGDPSQCTARERPRRPPAAGLDRANSGQRGSPLSGKAYVKSLCAKNTPPL